MLSIGRNRQAEIYLNGFQGKKSSIPFLASELEAAARNTLNTQAFGYLSGGAGAQQGVSNNLQAFDKYKLQTKMLQCKEDPVLDSTLLTTYLPFPFLFAPIGVLGLAHPEGDVELAKASKKTKVPMIQSSQASFSMEDCAKELENTDRWFQLYFSKSRELVESFIHRAENTACKAIVLTLDTTSLGWRSIDLNNGYLPFLNGLGIAQYTSDPVFLQLIKETNIKQSNLTYNFKTLHNLWILFNSFPDTFLNNLRTKNPLRSVQTFLNLFSRTELSWEDVKWLRDKTNRPLLLKGVLHEDDARKALDYGIDGLIVSNHGGRQMDRVVSSLDSLYKIKKVLPETYPILMDGGIRCGTDIFIALALGADAVCIGRPYAYSLAVAGRRGVIEYVQNLASELKITMSLCGCNSLSDINEEYLVREL